MLVEHDWDMATKLIEEKVQTLLLFNKAETTFRVLGPANGETRRVYPQTRKTKSQQTTPVKAGPDGISKKMESYRKRKGKKSKMGGAAKGGDGPLVEQAEASDRRLR